MEGKRNRKKKRNVVVVEVVNLYIGKKEIKWATYKLSLIYYFEKTEQA